MSNLLPRVCEFLLAAPLLDGVRLRLRSLNSDFVLSLLSGLMAQPLPLTSGRIMVIAPHQDDETLGCGGLIALKRQRGAAVQVVFLTDGGKSPLPADGHLVREELPYARIQEARAATHALGVPESDLHFLGLPDGVLKQLSDESRAAVVDYLCGLIRAHEPVKVFVPHWDDGHGDHEAAFDLAVEAVRRVKKKIDILQYSIWGPWLHPLYRPSCLRDLRRAYRLPIDAVQWEKSAAIDAYASQVATLPSGFLARFRRPYELFFPMSENVAGKNPALGIVKAMICFAGLELGLDPEALLLGEGAWQTNRQ